MLERLEAIDTMQCHTNIILPFLRKSPIRINKEFTFFIRARKVYVEAQQRQFLNGQFGLNLIIRKKI